MDKNRVISTPHFELYSPQLEHGPYQIGLKFPRKEDMWDSELVRAVMEAGEEAFPNAPDWRNPLKQIDGVGWAAARTKFRPPLFDAAGSELRPYDFPVGTICRAGVNIYAYNHSAGFGIGLGLIELVKLQPARMLT